MRGKVNRAHRKFFVVALFRQGKINWLFGVRRKVLSALLGRTHFHYKLWMYDGVVSVIGLGFDADRSTNTARMKRLPTHP